MAAVLSTRGIFPGRTKPGLSFPPFVVEFHFTAQQNQHAIVLPLKNNVHIPRRPHKNDHYSTQEERRNTKLNLAADDVQLQEHTVLQIPVVHNQYVDQHHYFNQPEQDDTNDGHPKLEVQSPFHCWSQPVHSQNREHKQQKAGYSASRSPFPAEDISDAKPSGQNLSAEKYELERQADSF
ncbi:hypothetical protein ON010_g1202 [Phytophthora cinnamomi]|nr:hypothetical protein ON010_g1202 [Phytophthora cinnamomi]